MKLANMAAQQRREWIVDRFEEPNHVFQGETILLCFSYVLVWDCKHKFTNICGYKLISLQYYNMNPTSLSDLEILINTHPSKINNYLQALFINLMELNFFPKLPSMFWKFFFFPNLIT